jgi:hypothetical protein
LAHGGDEHAEKAATVQVRLELFLLRIRSNTSGGLRGWLRPSPLQAPWSPAEEPLTTVDRFSLVERRERRSPRPEINDGYDPRRPSRREACPKRRRPCGAARIVMRSTLDVAGWHPGVPTMCTDAAQEHRRRYSTRSTDTTNAMTCRSASHLVPSMDQGCEGCQPDRQRLAR